MRHNLAQLLASSSSSSPGSGSPREPGAAAACSCPSQGMSARGGRESPGEAGKEAEPRHEEEDEEAAAAGDLLEKPDNDELLFPPGLELDDWLEAAMAAETRPDWAVGGGGGESLELELELEELPPSSRSSRPGSHRLKAAAAARLNRQKKKQYVQGLEARLQGLANENRQLRDRNRGLCRRLRDLERESSYLRAVLANQSAVGRLLSHLAAAAAGDGGAGRRRVGLRISTSLFEDPASVVVPVEAARFSWESGSNSSSSDHDYALPVPEEEEEEEEEEGDKRVFSTSPGGICLHVDRDQVSVEFCSVCARRAANSAFAATTTSAAASSSFASKIFSFRCLPCQAPLCRG